MRLGNQNKACYNNHGYKNRNAIEKPFQSTIYIPRYIHLQLVDAWSRIATVPDSLKVTPK